MKIKLDENLPRRLVDVLVALGHDVDTVPEEQIADRDDGVVWHDAMIRRMEGVINQVTVLDVARSQIESLARFLLGFPSNQSV